MCFHVYANIKASIAHRHLSHHDNAHLRSPLIHEQGYTQRSVHGHQLDNNLGKSHILSVKNTVYIAESEFDEDLLDWVTTL
jgi:hypothetical protein